jgi:hypothetical protein
MPNGNIVPPLVRIYTVTHSDQEAIARTREALERSMQILEESRFLTAQLLRTQQVSAQGNENAADTPLTEPPD